MLKKIVSGIVITLFLIGMLMLAFNIQPVGSDYVWSETIYIRADGSIEPFGAPIISVDNVTYTLTDNIVESVAYDSGAIIIQRNNIVLDGAGYTLNGTVALNSKGIYLSGRTNVTIQKIAIKNFRAGIMLLSSSNNVIDGNNITNNTGAGIYLGSSSSNSINGNNVTDNFDGIALGDSSNNSITGNNITKNNYYAINLYLSSSNSISGNNVANNWQGVRLASSSNCSVSGNNITATNNGHGIAVSGSSSCSISGNTITANSMDGINLSGSSNNTISGNNITNNRHGINLGNQCHNNSINGNYIAANTANGIALALSSNNNISENTITANIADGIYLYTGARNNSLSGNIIKNNNYGIRLESTSNHNSIIENTITANNNDGIKLQGPSNNSISSNNITANNGRGINLVQSHNNSLSRNNIVNNSHGIELWWSSNNTISGNIITANNWAGIKLSYSSNNVIYHNNFINNTQQTQIPTSGYANIWDDGYPSGGNYWSDYTGVDLYSSPDQNVPGSDGIGDTPYTIDAYNRDRYPSMIPYGAPPPLTYTLTITATAGGTTDPPTGTYEYTAGSSVNVTAFPNEGYPFYLWLLDGEVKTENPITVIMNANHTLEAFFVDNIPPAIGTPTQDPAEDVEPYQTVTVTVNVSDFGSEVHNVTLWYSIDNGTTWAPRNMNEVAANTYQTTIPGHEYCTWITYKIIAHDNAGNNATKDNLGYGYKYHVIPEFPTAIILPLFMTLSAIAIFFTKKKAAKTRNQNPPTPFF